MIKKGFKFTLALILCILNILMVLFFLNENKQQTLNIYENVQNRELYRINVNIGEETIEDFTEYIKTLKISSSQNWYIYEKNNDNFILYKDKVNQYIDSNIKNVFINSDANYLTKQITDVNDTSLLLTTKEMTIDGKKYIIGISENVSTILNTTNNFNITLYILGESLLLSLILLIFLGINMSNKSDFEKQKNKLIKEFEEYKTRFAEQKSNEKETIENHPIQNEDGSYTPYFLDMMIPKLEKNNILYNIYEMTDYKFWIIEDCIADNMYKIKRSEENIAVLLIDGTERQKKLLENFE